MSKPCKDCGIIKPLSEFYRHPMMADGTVNICKTCNKEKVRKNREQNIDYYQWYDQSRNATPRRILKRVQYAKQNSERTQAHKKLSADKYPDKKRARRIFGNAIRDGKIKRLPCCICGSRNSQGHHSDYSKPLDVVWLCPKHHAVFEERKKARDPVLLTPKRKLVSRALNFI